MFYIYEYIFQTKMENMMENMDPEQRTKNKRGTLMP